MDQLHRSDEAAIPGVFCFRKRVAETGWLEPQSTSGSEPLLTFPSLQLYQVADCAAVSAVPLYGLRRASSWVPIDADKSTVQGFYLSWPTEMALYMG